MRLNAVFLLALGVCVPVGLWGILAPEPMADTVLGFTTWFMTGASWWWLALCTAFVILAAALAFGPWGRIRLGRDDEEPEFSTVSWIAMLFAGGMGAGLLFWGVAEPVSHFASPPGIQGGTPEAARIAMVITNLHWGFHAWSIYGVCALVIAYFTFRRGGKPLISTPLTGLIGGPAEKGVSVAADVLGVVAVIFGLAGSLAMGTLQVRSGLASALGTPETSTISLIVLAVLFVAYMVSTLTGVEKGMKLLSNINMVLALAIMVFIAAAGPTAFIFESVVDTLGAYLSQIVAISFRLFPYEGLTEWSANWTLTYLIWWLAWGPFVGVFIARISRGRTIREFCAGVILVPTLFSIVWFAVFGGAGIYVELFGPGGLAALVADNVSDALFAFLGYFPLAGILSVVALVLIFIFLVTSADSGTFVLSMMTTDGNLNPSASAKIVWGSLVAVITAATLLAGTVEVARAMATLGAIPFSAVLILQVVGFLRALGEERRMSAPAREAV
ncbi:MAG TPA: BCCT family transporter [Alphaproteobacteria bacterium]|nr:BCCT family transporter [Alphaproteobacteria bacterium]